MKKLEGKQQPPKNQDGEDLLETLLQSKGESVPKHHSSPDQEFFIPVHGFVEFTNEEMQVINHPAFQRLEGVYQLGQAHIVFRGATHTRGEHVLGATHVAQMIIDAISQNREKHERANMLGGARPWGRKISQKEIIFIRLAALLHDIGHIPNGHTLEDELLLLPKHDEMHRLNLVFDRKEWFRIKCTTLRELVDTVYKPFLGPGGISITPTELVCLIISKDAKKTILTPPPEDVRLSVCQDIVGNTICADFLDYLHRDWLHIGKPLDFDKRLFHYMEIRDTGATSEFVISLGGRVRLRTDAISAMFSLLDSRYKLAESVLFHRAKCKASAMLERALMELTEHQAAKVGQEAWIEQLEVLLLDNSDYSFLQELLSLAKDCEPAMIPLRALVKRELYKDVSTTPYREITPETKYASLREAYATRANAPQNRLNAMRLLELDFKLAPGSLAMYCPSTGMNAKIPEVSIYLDGSIATYQGWNEEFKDVLDAGLMRAQIQRFQRLWRVQIGLEQKQFNRWNRKLRDSFAQAVKTLVLDLRPESSLTLEEACEGLAETLVSVEGSPYYGKQIEVAQAARSRTSKTYFFGGSPLRSFFMV